MPGTKLFPGYAVSSPAAQAWAQRRLRGARSRAAMLETLRDMMAGDSDAQVVANCMTVLQQAGRAQSFSSRGVVIPLVNRIKARPLPR